MSERTADPRAAIASEEQTGRAAFAAAADLAALESARHAYLGRRSRLTELRRAIGALSPDLRKTVGKSANDAVAALEAAYEERRVALSASTGGAASAVDVTLPGRRGFLGARHVLTRTFDEVLEIFHGMGFTA